MDAEARAAYREKLRKEAAALIEDPAVGELLEAAADRLIASGDTPVDDPQLVSAAILSVIDDPARAAATGTLQSVHSAGTPWSVIAEALGVARTTVYSTYAEDARKRNREAQRRYRERLRGGSNADSG